MAKVKKKNKPRGYWSNPDNLLAELAKFDNNWAEFCKAHPSGSRIAYRDKLVEKLGIGIAHNTTNKQELVDGYFIAYKLNKFLSNRIYNKVELEKEGYENSAKYLRRLML